MVKGRKVLGLLENNKLYINERNQIGALDRIIDLSNLNILETDGKKIVYNSNLMFLNKDIPYDLRDNTVDVKINLGCSRHRDMDNISYDFLTKIDLDKSILFINKFRDHIETVAD